MYENSILRTRSFLLLQVPAYLMLTVKKLIPYNEEQPPTLSVPHMPLAEYEFTLQCTPS